MSNYLDETGLGHLIEKIDTTYVAKDDTIAASTISIDLTPTNNSNNLVTSGGVQSALNGIQTGMQAGFQSIQIKLNGIQSSVPSVSGKADKVSGATAGHFAGLDANGNLTDSGHQHSDYATMIGMQTGFQGLQSQINGVQSSIPSISGKADKVSGATNGHFASLDSNGNLVDSGHQHSDYATQSAAIGSLALSINSSTYVLTLSGTKVDGTQFTVTDPIDLPLESMVVDGSYDASTKKVALELKSGSTVEFSIADLINGLQSEITAQNKLSADLIEDGTTNKVYTATEQTKLAGIQTGAQANVQANWNETNSSSDAYIQNKPDLTVKADKVTGAQAGNFAALDANGNLVDSGHQHSEYATIEGVQAGFQGLQSIIKDNEFVISFALNDLNSKINGVQSNIPSDDNKADKVTGAQAGNFAALDSNGNLVDSGHQHSDYVTSVNGQQGAVTLSIPTVNDTTVTLTMNNTTIGTFTLNKDTNTTIDLGTVLTAHQSIKTVNNESLVGTGNIVVSGLPQVSASDNGKILMVVNGQWQLVSPSVLYNGNGVPNNAQGNNGDLYMQTD